MTDQEPDQVLADADQTAANADQRVSGLDQRSAEADDTIAALDQRASDNEQAIADQHHDDERRNPDAPFQLSLSFGGVAALAGAVTFLPRPPSAAVSGSSPEMISPSASRTIGMGWLGATLKRGGKLGCS